MPLCLSLDIGTSSTRALLWDETGRELPGVRAQVQYAMRTTPDGGVEIDAAELVDHAAACLDAVLAQAADRSGEIKACGISTFWHSLLGIDAAGEPITPILSWADNRSASAARELRQRSDPVAAHRRTGCALHPSYYPAKLLWLRETRPDAYRRADRWISPSEFLFLRLFGKVGLRVSLSMASGTGLLNQQTCAWDSETLALIDLSEDGLSPICDLDEAMSGLSTPYRARWPALRDTQFFPAVGDGACGNVGSGCESPERLAINLGTSGAIRVVWDEQAVGRSPDAPVGLWRYRVDRRRPVMGAAFSDGGNVFAWMDTALKLPPVEELEREIGAAEPGAHGLAFLPFLAGERSMGWNPDARATLTGMNLATRPIDIAQAGMEAVALRFALAAAALRDAFPEARQIVASGGALGASPVWTQMFADALGQPVTQAAEPEASSRGAALLAMEAAAMLNAGSAAARLGATIEPRADRHARYMELLARQQDLIRRLGGAEQASLPGGGAHA